MAWTPPSDWVPGRGLTAAQLQTDLSDNLDAIGLWQTWTPTWGATTTNPVVGNGTMAGRYTQIGKLVVAQLQLLMGSTTTYGSGSWWWSLPVQPTRAQYPNRIAGTGWYYDPGVTTAMCVAELSNIDDSGTTVVLYKHGGSNFHSTNPQTWVAGDALSWRIIYEGA